MSAILHFVHGVHALPVQLEALRASHGLAPTDLVAIGPAALHDHALAFEAAPGTSASALALRPHLGSLAYGIVVRCSDRASQAIGHVMAHEPGPAGATPRQVEVFPDRGAPLRVLAWLPAAAEPDDWRPPSPEVLHSLREGLRHWRLPTRGLDNASLGRPGVDLVTSVFVYGTLLRGETRAGVWRRHRIRCAVMAVAPGRLYTTDDDYPAVKPSPDAGDVQGDFIRVAGIQRLLRELDEIEEYQPGALSGQLFRRVLTDVGVAGKVRRAWIYVAGDALSLRDPIETGSWRRHLGREGLFAQRLADFYEARLAGRPWQDLLETSALPPAGALTLAQALAQGRIGELRLAQRANAWTALT